jgi:SsrA-binding protein
MNEQVRIANIAQNRKARHEYEIIQTYEAGIVLTGTEVKSVRQNKLNMSDGYAVIRNSEIWLINVHINEYTQGNRNNHDPLRDRKLLLNISEIRKIRFRVEEKGFTLVPLAFYLKNGRVKVELALARGKKSYDKREAIAKKDFQRSEERKIKY